MISNETDFDLLERIRKKEHVENPFKRFNLSRNPFPKSAVADSTSERFFSRCRKKALEQMRDFIVYVYASRRWAGLVLKGEIGSGKSHMLFYVASEITRQLGELEKDRALAVYVESPKDSINDLYQDIMEKLGRDFFEAKVAAAIEEKAEKILKNLPRQYFLPTTEVIPQDPLYRLRKMGKGIGESLKDKALNDLAKELSNERLVQHRDFARCLGILAVDDDQEKRNAAWNFCIGKAISKTEAKGLGLVSEKLSEDEIVRYVFPSLIQILNKNGVGVVFLLIDEVEKIATMPTRRTFAFLENLRSLVDNNLSGLCIIFSCLAESWDILASTSPALSDRMSEIVDLDPLDSKDTILLIEDYLKVARINPNQGKPLSPFDEAAVGKINLDSKGSIRYILQNCNTVLEHAALHPEIKDKISTQFVEKILGA